MSLRRAGPSSRGVLPSVMWCDRETSKKWGGLGPQGAVEPLEKKISIVVIIAEVI
jgi:hypothetical protein